MKQEPLEERRKEYIHFCDEQANYYDKAATWNRKMNAMVQTIIITGAAVTPFLLNISQVPKIIPIHGPSPRVFGSAQAFSEEHSLVHGGREKFMIE